MEGVEELNDMTLNGDPDLADIRALIIMMHF